MTNLVWSELQDASSRTSQPHIGSDGAGDKAIPRFRQGPGQDFVTQSRGMPALRGMHGIPERPSGHGSRNIPEATG
jgi:hypothetical protein